MKYHHMGIPTRIVHDEEIYLEKYKLYCTDHASNPYGIQWMRYEPDSPLPDIVKTLPHVAFLVEDIKSALKNKKVIIEPNSPSEGVMVAFILEDGAPVELLQFTNK
jgi:hypothetical protein